MDYFIERYGTAYTSIIDHLEELITTGISGKEKFIAVGIEAGLGKSRETDRIIVEYLNVRQGFLARSFLLVKRFVTDVERTTEFLNNHSRIGKIALGITSNNWKEIQKNPLQIQDFPVVIITHSRYFRLSIQKGMRFYFELNRDTLIRDEQMELPVYSFSYEIWNEVNSALPSIDLRELHNEICRPLLAQMDQVTSVSNQLKKVRLSVNASLMNEYDTLIDVNWRHFKSDTSRNTAKSFVEFLKCANKYVCLYNHGRVSTYNKSAYLWKLSNNLILDANAGIDKRYLYARDIVIDKKSLAKVIDHSNTTVHPILFNSTRSRINKGLQPYYDKVCGLIAKSHVQGDKTLVVGHNRHENQLKIALQKHGFTNIGVGEKYKDEDIAVAHFGAIIGQNYWREFNRVWVIASPNYPMEVYPLYWAFTSQTPIGNRSLKMGGTKGKKGKYQFKNKVFEEIRHGCLVSEIYQAVKRINREGRNSAEIYIVHADIDVINDIINQLKNIKVGETLELEIDVEGEEKPKNAKESKNVQLVKLLKSLDPKVYLKKDIYEFLGWKNRGDLSRYLKDGEIVALKNAGLIDWSDKTITIFPKTAVAR